MVVWRPLPLESKLGHMMPRRSWHCALPGVAATGLLQVTDGLEGVILCEGFQDSSHAPRNGLRLAVLRGKGATQIRWYLAASSRVGP